jgi:hypothetical protein
MDAMVSKRGHEDGEIRDAVKSTLPQIKTSLTDELIAGNITKAS